MRSILFALLVTLASPALASAEKREPDDYNTDIAQWHYLHGRHHEAIDVAVRQFPRLQELFEAASKDEGKVQGMIEGDWYMEMNATTVVFAVLATDGARGVKPKAPWQKGTERKATLDAARAIRKKLPAQLVQELREREGNLRLAEGQHARAVQTAIELSPWVAKLPTGEADSNGHVLEDPKDFGFHLAIRSVAQSAGAIGFDGKKYDTKEARMANVIAAQNYATRADIHEGTLRADLMLALADFAKPPKRAFTEEERASDEYWEYEEREREWEELIGEYRAFVVQASEDGSLWDERGFWHAGNVFKARQQEAEELRRQHAEYHEPKPTDEIPENTCGE